MVEKVVKHQHDREPEEPKVPKNLLKIKVLQGVHQGPDYEADPIPVLGPSGEVTRYRFPPRTYLKGETFLGTEKVVRDHGVQKFLIVGAAKALVETLRQSSAPGGQVSSGFQETHGVPEEFGTGETQVTGPASSESVEKIQEAAEKDSKKAEAKAVKETQSSTAPRKK